VKRALLVLAAASLAGACSPTHGEPLADAGADVADATPAAPAWRSVLTNLDGALLGIWGTSEKDVWAVGGPLGNAGFEALALHFDGTAWKRMPAGGADSYWWVHGTSATDVWLVGEKGRITHWDGTKLEERASGTTATLFGVWAAAPDDAWAVGGVPDQPTAANDVLLHWDGAAWKHEALPETNHVALFKVWGASRDDLYVVGEAGLVWHRAGGTWTREAKGVASGRLTTVSGCSAQEVFAVGGRDFLVKASDWQRSSTVLVNDVNGVSCAPPGAPARDYGRAVIVGGGSLKLRLVGSEWQSDFGSEPFDDLHGSWVDPTGAFWAVGGKFNESPRPSVRRQGVIARYGPGTVPSTLAP
jgi:hypothetical protein